MAAAGANGADAGIVIVGAGIAGLYTALCLAPLPVTVLTAGRVGKKAASTWAQGGLAAAVGPDDSWQDHTEDTIAAGHGLVDRVAAEILCKAGPAAIDHLASLGVPFDRTDGGAYALGREAAHGTSRIVHVGGDEAGATIMGVLIDHARAAPHVTIKERVVALRLETDDRGVTGVAGFDRSAEQPVFFPAKTVVLATGGVGGLYAVTTNPLGAQGHGLVMAHEQGATLRDLEFVQFHPTGMDLQLDPAPLATEALRGAGATLHDLHGRRFMTALHPDGELAPRDVVARGVAMAIKETGGAFIDIRKALGLAIKQKFPTVYKACHAAGLDPVTRPIPIAPAAHYHMGGVLTDLEARTDIDGLYAVGEAASSGVHGANRLASNSLLEALVFGRRAADAIADENAAATEVTPAALEGQPFAYPLGPAQGINVLRHDMANSCGLLRDGDDLDRLLERLDDQAAETAGDRLSVAAMMLIARAALDRQHSRGAHQRRDFPDMAPPVHTVLNGTKITQMPLEEQSHVSA